MAEGVPRELLRDSHDLLLIHDEPETLAEDLVEGLSQFKMQGHDRLAAVFAVGVVIVRIGAHGPWSVERQHGGDVVEAVGHHRAQQRAHGPAVELEDPEGVTPAQQFVGNGIVECEGLEHDGVAPVACHMHEAVVEHREVTQAEEVHLEQTERLAGTHVELRDDGAILLAAPQRHDVDERLPTQDHSGSVHTRLPLETLEPLGGVDDLAHVGLGLVERPELSGLAVAGIGGVEGASKADVLAHDRGGEGLGDAVTERVGVTEGPGGVLDGRLGLDGAVGDDLRDVVFTVGLGGVADHVGAATVVEVDVDVGHRDALGVEEPLEQQPVLDRVELGDSEGPGDDRARSRTSTRPDADSVLLGVPHQVGHHEKVAREAHLDDDADLVLGLRPVGLWHWVRSEAARQPPLDLDHQPRLVGVPLGHGELGHQAGTLGEGHLAALGDQQGVVAGLGQLAPHLAHLSA
ncbi:unannotated protein [freshwater metagenome]|uniref:Unannotated protein n=1 Tax=freshwater metagenome TaxID=449393 RepID=A0A6J7K7K0_9ZZZZ